MLSMRCFVIIYQKCQMEFILAQIIGFLAVTQPGKLQQMRSFAVRQIYQNKAAVLVHLTVILLQAQSLLVKLQAFFQIQYIKVVMCESKFHIVHLSSNYIIYLKKYYLLQEQSS